MKTALLSLALVAFSPLAVSAGEAPAPHAVKVDATKETLDFGNGLVSVRFDLKKGTYGVANAAGEVVVADAGVGAAWEADSRLTLESRTEVTDSLGKGVRVVFAVQGRGYREKEHSASGAEPFKPLYSFTVYEGRSALVMGFGLKTPSYQSVRLSDARPIARAKLFPGKTIAEPLTLNGSAGSEPTLVRPGLTRLSANAIALTALVDGRRRTVVAGGLGYEAFGKYAALRDGVLELKAEDPVGRLVSPGRTDIPGDTFYLDVGTDEPFAALEQYGRAMRAANNAKPNVYDFPVLCGWGVGALSKLPGVNNSAKLVGELELAQKAGLTKYTKVGIRLEPDTYCGQDNGNTEQGWWDDAHWAKYKHLVPPYETFAKWCAAIRERDGVPYTYFQVGMPSNDYAKAFPGHMLFNDISQLEKKHPHHQPYVSFDYTDADFGNHMRAVWKRLRADGMKGIKFDYPETGWRSEGGFEDRHATTASAYRKAFELAREGLGPEAVLDERNLGESGRPCLEVTAGVVDTQRNWTDANTFVPAMVTIGGLRWYKNRTVFNYYPDSKVVHGCTPEMRRSMLTMVYLTSGRIDLATSFSLFTPEITHDFTRIYPAYREPFTARPVDAFTGVRDPQVYDLELTPDWHQVALFNSGKKTAVVGTALAGERVKNALGLASDAAYYAYDFWADEFLGKLAGTARLERTLAPSHCAMISLRKVLPHPQVLSTNRHVLQGWVDLSGVTWNAAAKSLTGTAKVVAGEPFRIVVATNGAKPAGVTATGGAAKLESHAAPGLSVIVLTATTTGDVAWRLACE